MKRKLLPLLLVLAASVPAFGQFSIQKVLVEEHTGAWCGWCVDGSVRLTNTLASNQQAIGVAWHNGDAMTLPEQADLDAFYVNGYPNATINRQADGQSRSVWQSQAAAAAQGASSVTVSFDTIEYNAVTRQISAQVKYSFTGPLSGDFRINMFVVEDNVTGSGTGYNQVNYDNTTAGHPYYGAGNPIVGFVHRHVVRAALEGPWGLPGVISSPVNFGSNFTHTFSYTLPAGYDENEIHLVALVSNHVGASVTERKILNSEEMPLITATHLQDGLSEANQFMDIYPNPMDNFSTIAFSVNQTGNIRVEILNTLGQQVALLGDGIMGAGAHTLYWDGRSMDGGIAPAGTYLVRLVTEHGQQMVKRLIVAQ